jgi:hypothetical protein
MFIRGGVRHAEVMDTTRTSPDRTLVVIISIIATLVIVSVAVVFTRGTPEPLDPATPAGTVQAYASLVIDGDELGAAEYLTETALDECDYFERGTNNDIRVTLLSTEERDDSADVRVSIIESYGNDPFGASEWETEDVFDLVKVDGEWKIAVAPWQLTVCPNKEVGS